MSGEDDKDVGDVGSARAVVGRRRKSRSRRGGGGGGGVEKPPSYSSCVGVEGGGRGRASLSGRLVEKGVELVVPDLQQRQLQQLAINAFGQSDSFKWSKRCIV